MAKKPKDLPAQPKYWDQGSSAPGLLPDDTLAVVEPGSPRKAPTIIDDDWRPEDFKDLEDDGDEA